MRLLIITQKVDSLDPILGFFHRWIAEFGKHCESVTVIGQFVGSHELPQNVHVHSLGKEKKRLRLFQILRFWKLQWSLRKEYDVVLVHMTPVWIVLGALSWTVLKKPMYLWYEAKGGGVSLRLAFLIVRKIFSASSSSVATRSKKAIVVGHGIDVGRFSPAGEREKGLLVTVGRITSAKNVDAVVRCLLDLPDHYHVVVAGTPISAADHAYLTELRTFVQNNALHDRVSIKAMTQEEVALLLQRAEFFLHASSTGLDKAMLEAMASGCLVLSSGTASTDVLPADCLCETGQMAERIRKLTALPTEEQQTLRNDLRYRIECNHSLDNLIKRLVEEMGQVK